MPYGPDHGDISWLKVTPGLTSVNSFISDFLVKVVGCEKEKSILLPLTANLFEGDGYYALDGDREVAIKVYI